MHNAYKECGFFNIDFEQIIYSYGDYERLKIESNISSIKEKRKEIVALLEQLGECYTEEDFQLRCDLEHADSLIVKAYDVLGKEEIEKLNYSSSKLKAAIIMKQHQQGAHSTTAIKLINGYFQAQKWYSSNNIKAKIIDIFEELDIPTKGVTAKTIKDYFEAIEKRTKKARGYFLIKSLFIQR